MAIKNRVRLGLLFRHGANMKIEERTEKDRRRDKFSFTVLTSGSGGSNFVICLTVAERLAFKESTESDCREFATAPSAKMTARKLLSSQALGK